MYTNIALLVIMAWIAPGWAGAMNSSNSPVPNSGFETGNFNDWTTSCNGASGGCGSWSITVGSSYAYTGQYGVRMYIARVGHWGGANLVSQWFNDMCPTYKIPMKLIGGATAFFSGVVIVISDELGSVQYRGNTGGNVFCFPDQSACEYFTLNTGSWAEYAFDFQTDYQQKYGRLPGNLRRVMITAYQDDDFVELYVDDVFLKPVLDVPLDIKPGSCPNKINVGSQGVLPVAVLGASDFDVMCIETEIVELQLAGVTPIKISYEDVATPFEPYTGKEDATDCNNSGPDGFMDLTLKFDVQEIVVKLEGVQDGEVLVWRFDGKLIEECGGTAVIGEDVVVILEKGKKADKQWAGTDLQIFTVEIRPNPVHSTGEIQVSVEGAGISHIRTELFYITGQRIYDSDFQFGNVLSLYWSDIAGTGLSNGIYVYAVSVMGENGDVTQKRMGKLILCASG